MKLSTRLLGGLFILMIVGLLASVISIKENYDNADKDDFYWGYSKILEEPFRHIKIEGGNIAQIAFEQYIKPSVRILKQWPGYEKGSVKAFVRADTLFVTFPNEKVDNPKLQDWMKHATLVRIFSPDVVSIEGVDTKLDLFKLHQKSITIHLSGRSEMEVESELSNIDTLRIAEDDSSNVFFEMSPDAAGSKLLRVQSAELDVRGASRLDLGLVQMKSFKLNITDSAVIQLSGLSYKNQISKE
jgi:hypothetical protein